MNSINLKNYLDELVLRYNRTDFIPNDPISVPHQFTKQQDIEIIGFWTAILSWGLRKTIIRKAQELCDLMDHAPYDFIINHKEKDRTRFLKFKHRTFNATDTIYFLSFLQAFYRENNSLESLFYNSGSKNLYEGLSQFRSNFFNLPDAPLRTRKHIANPSTGSTCKRINMFLRWMVRDDPQGVDFGIWKKIKAYQLYIPLDVHVEKQARKLGLIQRKQRDWKTVIELTDRLKQLDPKDPVKYDFALFGLGIDPVNVI